MLVFWSPKDPAETESYAFDFSSLLGSDTISGAPTIASTGATVGSPTVNGSKVNVEISGGIAGTVSTITCTATTNGGQTLDIVAVLPIDGQIVDLATAKLAQKIETTDEDLLLAGYLRAAIRHIEKATSRNLTQRTETQVLAGFPRNACEDFAIRLWRGPVSSLVSIKYDDTSGVEQTLTSFRLIEGIQAQLMPAYGSHWPSTKSGPGTVRVTYVAGYDPTDRDIPLLIQAALMLFGHFNANREAVLADMRVAAVELPLGVQMLIDDLCIPVLA